MAMLILIINAVLVQNILLAQYLGNCPFCGVSKKLDTASSMGFAVVFVITLASAITWCVQYYILEKLGMTYLQTMVFILVIAGLVQFVELFLKKLVPPMYRAMGIYLPLITTNCAVLGVAILVIKKQFTFMESVVFAFCSAAGFMLALVLMAGLRQRFEISPIPKALQGTAITLLTA